MFVRTIKHANGKTYVQVIEKLNGKYVVKQSFGSAIDAAAISALQARASAWIDEYQGLLSIDFPSERHQYEQLLGAITSHKLVGIQLVLGKLFDEIGFNAIAEPLFKDLVLYRLVYPKSKLKTIEYLYRYEQKEYSEDDIYRYMDKLHSSYKTQVQQISYQHSLSLFTDGIQVVFYDVTTLYFEIDRDDDLRQSGFSKDGKHQHPQIVLGLLVSQYGYPLAYEIFDGKKFEGHTMLPILQTFRERYALNRIVVVADAGLLSNENITQLEQGGYDFILGARIKNEKQALKTEILSKQLANGESAELKKGDLRLIISYSQDRADRDKYNREKGLKRLEKLLKTGRLTKSGINNRGYNKFLCMQGAVELSINKVKIAEDQQWDGLKGWLTNASLSKEQVIENYNQLWQIERAFRIAKSDIKIRPIFHRKQTRIEAHICLCFVAHKIYKELERKLKRHKAPFSAEKAIEILQNIYQIEMITPKEKIKLKKTIIITQEQRLLAQIFGFGC